jgi:hypothetical protein
VHAHQRHRHLALAATFALGVAACSGGEQTAPTTPAPTLTTIGTTAPATSAPTSAAPTTTGSTTTTTTLPPVFGSAAAGLRRVAPFADYRYVAALDDTTLYAGPATPTSLGDVLLVPAQEFLFGGDFTSPEVIAELRTTLEASGFAVLPTGYRFFHDGYKQSTYEYEPLFITTDALYHSWHLAFDKVLRDTEQQHLLPILERFLTSAVDAARAQEAELAGTAIADSAHRATAYYESAAVLLGLDVGDVNDLTQQELAKAQAAVGPDLSPITGIAGCDLEYLIGCVNYGLFVPRGHYTRTPELTRYFLGMSLLGQEGFPLARGVGVVPALLLTRVLVQDPALLADWRAIYEPTAFLVGLADDIDPTQAAAAADAAAPGWRDDPLVLATADAAAIAAAVIAAHPVKIDPESASIRLMGARFTLDSFVLDQMAFPNVGRDAPEQRRKWVSPLDLAAAFGSPLARQVQLATEADYLHYTEQLDAMTELVASRTPDDWAGTVYDAWLLAIGAQFDPNGAAYPDFMQNDAWAAKALQTGLASYTELKHDTVLYTKQGSAGEGEGPQPGDFEKRNWVEPDPVAFGRIAAAAELLRDGFAERDLLTPDTDDLLGTLIELSDFLGAIATRELAGQVATDAENERLDGIGSELEYLWIASSDIQPDEFGQIVPDYKAIAGLVTDVFTNPEEYLQLGTGGVDTVYVIVPIGDGRFELAVGRVASYYEFWRASSEPRLTDEEWRTYFAGDTTASLPPRPRWVAPFLVGGDVATDPIVRW